LNHAESKQQIVNESFHCAVGPALLFGQLFGMLPVENVLGRHEENLRFRWRSPRTIYSIFFLVCGSIESAVGTRRLVRLGFNIHFAESFMFLLTTMLRSFYIFRLAMKWQQIMLKWRELESVFLRAPYKVKGWSLSRKIRSVFAFLMTFVIGECACEIYR
jgi:gustatory receptor